HDDAAIVEHRVLAERERQPIGSDNGVATCRHRRDSVERSILDLERILAPRDQAPGGRVLAWCLTLPAECGHVASRRVVHQDLTRRDRYVPDIETAVVRPPDR